MKSVERHSTGTFDLWETNYRTCVSRISSLTKSLPEMPEAVGTVVQLEAERAALSSLRSDSAEEICESLHFAMQAAAAAFTSARYDKGEVRAALGPERLSIPVTGPTSTVHVGTWLFGLSSSVICRDQFATAILCLPESIGAARGSSSQGNDAWGPFACAVADAVRGDATASRANTSAARKLMDPSSATLINPDFVQNIMLPLLELWECLMEGHTEAWNDVVAAALEQHRNFWSSENRAYDSFGFLAFDIAAACALAFDRGIRTEIESAYLPLFLVEGKCAASRADVVYVFPPAGTRTAAEANLYMDLRGCRHLPRRHELVERDGRLLALYECEGSDTVEKLAFQFEISEDEGDQTAPSTLIDAGEYLWLAEKSARVVPAMPNKLSTAQRSAARTALQDAIGYLREVLKFIPPSQTRVPNSAIWTSAGRKMLEAEPGRFSRARLEAVLNAWLQLLPNFGGDEARELALVPDEHSAALLSMEVIRVQVMPILTGIVRDPAGAFARKLAPREEDYARVFVGDAVETARRAYKDIWERGLQIQRPISQQREIRCFVAPAGMLGSENELSFQFPSGYRSIAHWLNPHRVWVAWKYVAQGQSTGLAFDGLVWCDDHWAWFPKPYRALIEVHFRPSEAPIFPSHGPSS